jgi:hypothetical protein
LEEEKEVALDMKEKNQKHLQQTLSLLEEKKAELADADMTIKDQTQQLQNQQHQVCFFFPLSITPVRIRKKTLPRFFWTNFFSCLSCTTWRGSTKRRRGPRRAWRTK